MSAETIASLNVALADAEKRAAATKKHWADKIKSLTKTESDLSHSFAVTRQTATCRGQLEKVLRDIHNAQIQQQAENASHKDEIDQIKARIIEAKAEFLGIAAAPDESPDRPEFRMPDFAPYFDAGAELPGRRVAGYIGDLDFDAYKRFPAVNASLLKEPTQAEMLHRLTGGAARDDYATEARAYSLTLGSLVHFAVLEPHVFDEGWGNRFVESPTKGIATQAAQEVRAENPGKTVLTLDMLDSMRRCRDAIWLNPMIRETMSPKGRCECSGLCWDDASGVWRKTRPDYLPDAGNYMVDVKTISAPIYRFADEAWKWGYYMQAAWYLDTHQLLTGQRLDLFYWVVVSTDLSVPMARLIEFENLPADHALYAESKLRIARERIGLDDSGRIGRLQMFVAAANETIEVARNVDAISERTARQIWPAYEQESPIHKIL